MGKHGKQPFRVNSSEESPPLNHEQKRIADWLKKLRFKKMLFGGVSELDVWKKIDELNRMYSSALIAERARYDALLERRRTDTEAERRNDGGV